MPNKRDIELMAHLMRRAGFGATREELEIRATKGYEATVEELLAFSGGRSMGDDLIKRFHHELSGLMGGKSAGEHWLYHLITNNAPLEEKVALLWHNIFATGYPKVVHAKVLTDQIRMFRRYGMGNFERLLVELSKDPAMIIWLDNQDNHKDAINENYGRELLELFSLGVGNYTEQDIKEGARAFTGWTIGNREYMELRSMRDSDWPYGRIAWHFAYVPDDHDDGEKEFLGQRGRFNGEDILEIICRNPATARFICRHMYHFFVADEPPVPHWPYVPPKDPQAIDLLTDAYFESGYDIRSMLRVLFNSDFFKSEECWYEKVKSPAEFVAGILRLTGEFDRPRLQITERWNQLTYMGQELNNPPSVEGWHQGTEWIDTGSLVERINFASEQFGDESKPGVKAIIDNIVASLEGQPKDGHNLTSDQLVSLCLDQMGAISVSDETRDVLLKFAEQGGLSRQDVAQQLRLTASTREFQLA